MKKTLLLLVILALAGAGQKAKGQMWEPVEADAAFNAKSFAIYNGEVYAGFHYYPTHHLFCVAKIEGNKWTNLGEGIPGVNSEVMSLAEYKGELYVGGWFEEAGGKGKTVNSIARWDGKAWHDVGGGVNGFMRMVVTMVVYNDELYIGGSFKTVGGSTSYDIAKWNGKKWSSVGPGFNSSLNALVVYKGELYAGGGFSNTLGKKGKEHIFNIAKWDGTKWVAVGNLTDHSEYNVNSMVVYKDELYVGGYTTKINGKPANGIIKWDGTTWTTVGKGITGYNNKVKTLAADEKYLYVGGFFGYADGKTVNNIAKWDGKEWSSLGKGTSDVVQALFCNKGELWVTGLFKEAGGKKIEYMAKYKE